MSLSKQERHDRLLELTLREFEHRRRLYQPYFRAQAGWYDQFRGYWQGSTDAQFNNIHVPLTNSVIMSDVAGLVQIELGGQTPIQMIPVGPEDWQESRKAEALLEGQFYKARMKKKLTRLALQANICGVGVAQYGYSYQYGPVSREAAIQNGRGAPWKIGATNLKYEGPDIRIVDSASVFPEPGFSDIEDMNSFIVRFYTDIETIKIRAAQGPNGEPAPYDAEWVKRFVSQSGSARSVRPEEEALRRSFAAGGMSEHQTPAPPSAFDSVEIVERWGRVPTEFGLWYSVADNMWSHTELPDSRRVTELIVTMANRTHILRAVPIYSADQQKPFLAFKPHEDPYHFHSPGKAELLSNLNAATNKLVSSQLDILDLSINPPKIVNRWKVDTRRYKHGPGRNILTDGPTSEQDIRPYMQDLRGAALSFQEVEYFDRLVQKVSGQAEDVAQGGATSKRQSATEYAGRTDAVATRMGLEAALLESEFMEPLAMAWWELDRQFLPTPFLVRQLGGNAIWDPVTERFQPAELDVITDLDLAASWNFRATGAARQLGKFAKQQQMLALLPAMVPFLPMINARAFIRSVLPVFDFTNVDEIMNTQDIVMQGLLQWMNEYWQSGGQGETAGKSKSDPKMLQRMLNIPGREAAPQGMVGAVEEEIGV